MSDNENNTNEVSNESSKPQEKPEVLSSFSQLEKAKVAVASTPEEKKSESTSESKGDSLSNKLRLKKSEPQFRRKRVLGDLFTGRRKVSIARVKMVKGTGKITVNKKDYEAFFPRASHRFSIHQPLVLCEVDNEYDIKVNVKGGGVTGQAEAIRLGIARCLETFSEENHKKLRQHGFLTRDSRMVERKKYGLHKARRASQFSKR